MGKIYPIPSRRPAVYGRVRAMKYMFLLILVTLPAWGRPLILISYFDPFGGSSFNNSERIGKILEAKFNAETSLIEVKLCSLNTIFDKAYAQTEECLKNLPERPVMVIGLGESTCQLKIETMMRNNDKTYSPDNAGVERNNSPIIYGAPKILGLRYPLPQMFCALTDRERKDVDVSNDAGSFVCNNTAYQMSYHYPEIQYGFIHVPANNCSNLKNKTEAAVTMLEKMILSATSYLSSSEGNMNLPHSSNDIRLPTDRDELKLLRRQYDEESCIGEFLRKSRPDDKRRMIINRMMN